jgi:hypothetical protein
MNAHNSRISNFLQVVMPLAAFIMVGATVAAEDKPAVSANLSGRSAVDTAPAGSTRSDRQTVLLVRASAVPLGENSVTSVSSQEAQQELKAIESGLFRRSLAEPKVLSLPEQGGWVRGFFKEPKASKLWSFFNPKAPLDSETDLMRSARIFGIRGDAPLPQSMQDPIQVEPVGIRFWQMSK